MTVGTRDRLPKSIEAERLTLGSIVAFPRCGPAVFRKLRPTDFVDVVHQKIYRAMLAQHGRGMSVDPPLLAAELKSDPVFGGNAAAVVLDLGQSVATDAHVDHCAEKVVESARKRRLLGIGEYLVEGSMNGQTSGELLNAALADIDDLQREAKSTDPRFRVYSAAQLDSATFETKFAIRDALVVGEPCGLGAPEKSLKTTIMIAAGVALNTPTDFLGHFPVDRRRNFLMFSGESSLATIQETARRICHQAGVKLSELDGFNISPDLPQLDDLNDLTEFEAIVADYAPDVVAIDPMMLCMGDVEEKAANMFSMGKLLRRLNEGCQKHEATLLFAHHTSGVPQYGATPKLSWFAFSGFKQFVRQWWLLNRIEEYQPGTGLHRLKFVAGGSAGHSGLWVVEIDEGRRSDPGGRRWAVAVRTVDEVRQGDQQRKGDAKAAEQQQQLDADREAICRLMAKYPDGTSKTFIRDHCGVSGRRWPSVFANMFQGGELIECDITIGRKKTPITGYKLNTSEGA